jgi:hypothetical protein
LTLELPDAMPVPAVPSLDGFSLRRLTAADAVVALEITLAGDHPLLFDIPTSLDGCRALIESARARPWGLPMLCLRDGRPAGWVVTGLDNLRALNAFVLAVFLEPSEASLALALCVRHLFWNFPLHRLYTQFPLIPAAASYRQLYARAGFKEEGVMLQHAVVAGQTADVVVFGVLRDEFDEWAIANEPRLSL